MTMNEIKFVILEVRVTFHIQYIVYFMITSKIYNVSIFTD